MAGHSQFKNIMFRKGGQDKKRSKLFSKLAREITVSAKSGLPDPAHNPKLRAAIAPPRARRTCRRTSRPRHQEGAGRRCGDLRRGALRGLRSGRRRHHRRGADRQPQPHRRRRPLLFSKLRRRARQPARSPSSSTVSARSSIRRQGLGRRHAGKGDRGRRRRGALQRRRPRVPLPSQASARCATRWRRSLATRKRPHRLRSRWTPAGGRRDRRAP